MKYIEYKDRTSGALRKEIVPGEKWLQWLYHNPVGKIALSAVVKRKCLSEWYGGRMDLPSSTERIPEFVQNLNINMGEATRPMDDYTSFNDFFIRELKPGARPIDEDPNSVVSPADGKVLAFDGITGLDSFFVKGQEFNLDSFLRDPNLTRQFEGGTLLIIRLAPVDYHRFHFPADGIVSESRIIDGDYYSVSPYAVKDRLSVYWENKRARSVLRTKHAGAMVLCEVGATMVGSIVQTHKANTEVEKGQEKGWFKFGGSTVIMLLEKGKVRIDKDLLDNTRQGYETSIRMGERVGLVNG
ncbi:phosphatidylserine decarboxylase [Pseudodesulfovibrio sp. zrk46]|uniref:phosphatidylserine decarboxylase n=1 Tax=Pseudodesulfovibrio sp. zrk46 TaxID=2725288 RepID=UPI0014496BEE|nr:phosphatidylserine decarboxylase [Pseudodesulfovibrio sp. zrk46]QJB57097.1 phosphatidylserine decarboxylase [Pseudodesulfovibrio sp. zrk46]